MNASESIKLRVKPDLAKKVKEKKNYSDWIRTAIIEKLERERLESKENEESYSEQLRPFANIR